MRFTELKIRLPTVRPRPCMLILERAGLEQGRPNKRSEQTFSVFHNAYVSVSQKDGVIAPQSSAE